MTMQVQINEGFLRSLNMTLLRILASEMVLEGTPSKTTITVHEAQHYINNNFKHRTDAGPGLLPGVVSLAMSVGVKLELLELTVGEPGVFGLNKRSKVASYMTVDIAQAAKPGDRMYRVLPRNAGPTKIATSPVPGTVELSRFVHLPDPPELGARTSVPRPG